MMANFENQFGRQVFGQSLFVEEQDIEKFIADSQNVEVIPHNVQFAQVSSPLLLLRTKEHKRSHSPPTQARALSSRTE